MAIRFCTNCGCQFPDAARFCTQCGQARAGAPVDPAPPALAKRIDVARGRYAPVVVVVVVLLVVAGAITVGSLTPRVAPKIVPRQGGAAQAPAGQQGQQAALPQDHPPVEIPAQVKESIANLQAKADENPDDLRTWQHLAEVLYRSGQIEKPYLEQAKKAFSQVLVIDPLNLIAMRSLGNIAFDQEQAPEAIKRYEAYLEVKPDDLSVQTDLATMHLANGDATRAVRMYDAVLKADPEFFQAQFNLALAYRAAGQDDAALATLRTARENAPDDHTRGQIDRLLGRVAVPGTAPGGEIEAHGGGFRMAIESLFRTHSILASKVQRFDWQDDHDLKLILTGFPMEQMPKAMRELFLSKMAERVATQKKAHAVDREVRIELVDFESNAVMDTIVQ